MKKRVKKMLLVGGALVAAPLAAGCGPMVYANPKGCFYDDGVLVDGVTGNPCDLPEAGTDASDASPFGDATTKDASDGSSDAASDAPADAPSDAPSDAPADGG